MELDSDLGSVAWPGSGLSSDAEAPRVIRLLPSGPQGRPGLGCSGGHWRLTGFRSSHVLRGNRGSPVGVGRPGHGFSHSSGLLAGIGALTTQRTKGLDGHPLTSFISALRCGLRDLSEPASLSAGETSDSREEQETR